MAELPGILEPCCGHCSVLQSANPMTGRDLNGIEVSRSLGRVCGAVATASLAGSRPHAAHRGSPVAPALRCTPADRSRSQSCSPQYQRLLKLQAEGMRQLQRLSRSEGDKLCSHARERRPAGHRQAPRSQGPGAFAHAGSARPVGRVRHRPGQSERGQDHAAARHRSVAGRSAADSRSSAASPKGDSIALRQASSRDWRARSSGATSAFSPDATRSHDIEGATHMPEVTSMPSRDAPSTRSARW